MVLLRFPVLFLQTFGSSVSLNNVRDQVPIKGRSLKRCPAAVDEEAAEVTEKAETVPLL